jgi:hypothetical protein
MYSTRPIHRNIKPSASLGRSRVGPVLYVFSLLDRDNDRHWDMDRDTNTDMDTERDRDMGTDRGTLTGTRTLTGLGT